MAIHQPVLLQQAIDALAIKTDGVYIDGTFGRGGHAEAILAALSREGRLLVMDKDVEAIHVARELENIDSRLLSKHDSFAHLKKWITELKLLGKVNGILLDLGVSSPQLDNRVRGFSFLRDGELDMRMDQSQGMTAKEWINQAKEKEIETVLREYGEERFAKRIAKAIVFKRGEEAIKTTKQLAKIIEKAIPKKEKQKHPATRSFQAIRIYVNQELYELKQFLNDSLETLTIGGRLAVISFHSLEDRLVKQFMKQEARGDYFPAKLAVKQSELHPRLKIIESGIKPNEKEIVNNPRARSAVMRVAEKIAV